MRQVDWAAAQQILSPISSPFFRVKLQNDVLGLIDSYNFNADPSQWITLLMLKIINLFTCVPCWAGWVHALSSFPAVLYEKAALLTGPDIIIRVEGVNKRLSRFRIASKLFE